MIARAVKCYGFASGFGEFVKMYRRAFTERPYIIHTAFPVLYVGGNEPTAAGGGRREASDCRRSELKEEMVEIE